MIRGLIIGLCFHLGAPFKASSIGVALPGLSQRRMRVSHANDKGFRWNLRNLSDPCRQFTTGKSPILILTCNIGVSIQPWINDTGDIGTTRPTSHPREIDSCVEGMLPSLLEQQMEESDYL